MLVAAQLSCDPLALAGDAPMATDVASHPGLELRIVRAAELPALRNLRRQALTEEPLAFAGTPADDPLLRDDYDPALLDRPGQSAMLGAWREGELTGMTGLYRHAGSKYRHKLQLWGMYVAPVARGRGLAARLLAAAITLARSWPDALILQLCVHRESEPAWRLYTRAGFVQWGQEPGGFRHDGRLIDDRHLSMRL